MIVMARSRVDRYHFVIWSRVAQMAARVAYALEWL
jgi:hypothetical protein